MILANDPDVCADVIDGLANGTYVVVLENNIRVYRKKETLVMPLFRCMVTTKGLQLQLSTTISIARILKVDGLLPWKSRKRLNLHYSCSRRVMKQLRLLSTL